MNHFPAKAILFGEYAVLLGGQVLAVPLPNFGGSWQKADPESASKCQFRLPEFARSEAMNLAKIEAARFQKDLANGLFFESTIPNGYGLGSSGAVVAAVYEHYCFDKEIELFLLKEKLGLLESFFHGKSSGIDPLISFLNKPVKIDKDKIETVSLNYFELNSETQKEFYSKLFLLDCGFPRQSKPLITWFLSQTDNVSFVNQIEQNLLIFNQNAIQALTENNWPKLMENWKSISKFQLKNWLPLIPEILHKKWKAGIDSDNYQLKLCGAGGGGFMLGISTNWKETLIELADFKLTII